MRCMISQRGSSLLFTFLCLFRYSPQHSEFSGDTHFHRFSMLFYVKALTYEAVMVLLLIQVAESHLSILACIQHVVFCVTVFIALEYRTRSLAKEMRIKKSAILTAWAFHIKISPFIAIICIIIGTASAPIPSMTHMTVTVVHLTLGALVNMLSAGIDYRQLRNVKIHTSPNTKPTSNMETMNPPL